MKAIDQRARRIAEKAASQALEALTLIRVLQTQMVALRDTLDALEAGSGSVQTRLAD